MFCVKCGAEVNEDQDTCPKCGAKLEKPTPSAQVAPGAARPSRRAIVVGAAAVVVVLAAFCGIGVAGMLPRPFSDWFGTSGLLLEDVSNEKLRSYLSSNVDADGNGAISKAEAEKVTAFGAVDEAGQVSDAGISVLDIDDYAFVAEFPNLEVLVCENNPATELNVSGLGNLRVLVCSGGELTTLQANGCKKLERVVCRAGKLTSVSVEGDSALTSLDCAQNQIAALNVAATDGLKTLDCSNNQLSALDTTGSPTLETLDCSNNQLVDLKPSAGLVTLNAAGNQLASIDFSACGNLGQLAVDTGVEYGTATEVDDDVRGNLSALALEYIYCTDGSRSNGITSATAPLDPSNVQLGINLLHTALAPSWHILYWYGADAQQANKLVSASSILGIGDGEPIYGDVSLSGAQVQKIMRSFYGVEVDLDKLASAGTSVMGRTSTEGDGGTWYYHDVAGALATRIYTSNFKVAGKLTSFDAAVQKAKTQMNDDKVSTTYYTVTAVKDNDSIFGYHLVGISDMLGDAAAEFPEAEAAQAVSDAGYDFTGKWICDEMYGIYNIEADGSCTAYYTTNRGNIASAYKGTWERSGSDGDSITCSLTGDAETAVETEPDDRQTLVISANEAGAVKVSITSYYSLSKSSSDWGKALTLRRSTK